MQQYSILLSAQNSLKNTRAIHAGEIQSRTHSIESSQSYIRFARIEIGQNHDSIQERQEHILVLNSEVSSSERQIVEALEIEEIALGVFTLANDEAVQGESITFAAKQQYQTVLAAFRSERSDAMALGQTQGQSAGNKEGLVRGQENGTLKGTEAGTVA